MRATYRNSIRSKELIKEALIELISSKKNLSEITVTEIVKVANINRGTFYNHYSNVSEVFEEMKDELIKNFSETAKKTEFKKDIDSFIHAIVNDYKKNEQLYKHLFNIFPREVFDDLKMKFIEQLLCLKPNIDKFKLYFVVNGVSGIYVDYIDEKITDSIDELGEKTICLLNNIIFE